MKCAGRWEQRAALQRDIVQERGGEAGRKRERRRTRCCALHVPGANEKGHSVTGRTRSGKRAEHAHSAVASQSRRGGCGSWLPHFVALIRFERVARERAETVRRRARPLRKSLGLSASL